jgi:ATP-dependent Lhr-like helicase
MRTLYRSNEVPRYLDATAQTLFAEGRAAFHAYGHATHRIFSWAGQTILFPWRGDRIMNTLTVILAGHGLEVGQDGLAITVGNCSPAQLLEVIKEFAVSPPPDPVALASTVRAKMHDKYDRYLGEELLNLAYAARALDVPGAWASLAELAALPTPATVAPLSVAPRRPGQV